MNQIFIKTKRKEGEERRLGLMMVPASVTNDDTLYAFVRVEGRATLRVFRKDNPFELEPLTQVLDPSEFEETWMGD